MKFWDASAVFPLVVYQKRTAEVSQIYRRDDSLVVWWGTEVEIESGLARLEREGVKRRIAAEGMSRLDALRKGWHEISPSETLRRTARRLLRTHPLRTADALQLAAALTAAESRPETLGFVCLDERLAAAAQREGFPIEEV